MSPLTGPTNIVTEGVLNQTARVTWSRRRAWHGEKVKMQLRTDLVRDETAVELQVLDDAEGEVEKISGKKVAAGAFDHDYDIAWKTKDVGDKREFKLAAKVGDRLQAAPSPFLYIDLDEPVFSA